MSLFCLIGSLFPVFPSQPTTPGTTTPGTTTPGTTTPGTTTPGTTTPGTTPSAGTPVAPTVPEEPEADATPSVTVPALDLPAIDDPYGIMPPIQGQPADAPAEDSGEVPAETSAETPVAQVPTSSTGSSPTLPAGGTPATGIAIVKTPAIGEDAARAIALAQQAESRKQAALTTISMAAISGYALSAAATALPQDGRDLRASGLGQPAVAGATFGLVASDAQGETASLDSMLALVAELRSIKAS